MGESPLHKRAKKGGLNFGGIGYYLKLSGSIAANMTLNIGGVYYTFDANGVWIY